MSSHLWFAMKIPWLVLIFFVFVFVFFFLFLVVLVVAEVHVSVHVYFSEELPAHQSNNFSVYVLPEVPLTSSFINKKGVQMAMIL